MTEEARERRKEYLANWRKTHQFYIKKYYWKNREKNKKKDREKYLKNKEKICERLRNKYATDSEFREKSKEYSKLYRQKMKEQKKKERYEARKGYFIYNDTEEHLFKYSKEACEFLGCSYATLYQMLSTDKVYKGYSADWEV